MEYNMTEQMQQMREFLDKLEERFSKKLDKVEDKIDKLADISVTNSVKPTGTNGTRSRLEIRLRTS